MEHVIAFAQTQARKQLVPYGEHQLQVPPVGIPVDMGQEVFQSDQALHADEHIPAQGRIAALIDLVILKADDMAVRLQRIQRPDLRHDVLVFLADPAAQTGFGASGLLKPLLHLRLIPRNRDDLQRRIQHAARGLVPNPVHRSRAAPAQQFRRILQLPATEKGHIASQALINTLHCFPHRQTAALRIGLRAHIAQIAVCLACLVCRAV